MEGFSACFQGLDDPRVGNAGRHEPLEILMIALCTTLCGGQTAVDMAEFGLAKEGFLRRFLALMNGISSHDTFSRVFRFSILINFGPVSRLSCGVSRKLTKALSPSMAKCYADLSTRLPGKSPLHSGTMNSCSNL